MQPKKPNCIEVWELARDNPPKVCWNCDFYNTTTGECSNFNAIPPQEFAETPGACEAWDRMPF